MCEDVSSHPLATIGNLGRCVNRTECVRTVFGSVSASLVIVSCRILRFPGSWSHISLDMRCKDSGRATRHKRRASQNPFVGPAESSPKYKGISYYCIRGYCTGEGCVSRLVTRLHHFTRQPSVLPHRVAGLQWIPSFFSFPHPVSMD